MADFGNDGAHDDPSAGTGRAAFCDRLRRSNQSVQLDTRASDTDSDRLPPLVESEGKADAGRSLIGIPLVALDPTLRLRKPIVAHDAGALFEGAEPGHAARFARGLILGILLSLVLWTSLAWIASRLFGK